MVTSSSNKKRDVKSTDVAIEKRPKRLKVGRACYSCRVKKIKCDGVQPCMQCKARQRPCTFSADGAMDDEDIAANESGRSSNDVSPMQAPTVLTPNCTSAQSQRQQRRNTARILECLGSTCPGEGNEGKWYIDEQHLLDPLYNDYDLNHAYHYTSMPPRKVQLELIQFYYQYKYPLFHMVPQALFIQRFNENSPFISPILLLAMFAHAAQIRSKNDDDDDDVDTNEARGDIDGDYFFEQARVLLDKALNVPSLSTVVALCIMSLYEPKNDKDSQHMSLTYSALAFRMCNRLGLGQHDQCLDVSETELRKRVAWGCYCLDKVQGICLGDPWLLRMQDMNMDLPRSHWSGEDQEQMECFVAVIKLMQMAERLLKPGQFMRRLVHMDESYAMQLHEELTRWLEALPLHLRWTRIGNTRSPTAINDILTDPPKSAWIAHLHLLFNMIQQRILLPFASPSCGNQMLQQQSTSAATHLTELSRYFSAHPNNMMSYSLTGTATMMATRVHLLNCGHENAALASHARYMFHRVVRSLSTLIRQHEHAIPDVDSFVAKIEQSLHMADTRAVTAAPTVSMATMNIMDPFSANHDTSGTNSTHHLYLSGSEQNAVEVLSHAYGTSSACTPTFDWRDSPSQHPHPPPIEQITQDALGHSLHQNVSDPLDFLSSASMDDIWNERMAPSSVDALLYKARFLMEDHRQPILGSGGLLMSHAKLNDPVQLSHWMMRHTKERHDSATVTSLSSSSSSSSSSSMVAATSSSLQADTSKLSQPSQPLTGASPSSSTVGTSTVEMNGIVSSSVATSSPDATVSSLIWPVVVAAGTSSNIPPSLPMASSSSSSLSTSTSASASLALSSSPRSSSHVSASKKVFTTPSRPLGQYMNIGLGVYASAHQHHNDVIRQHIPDTVSGRHSRPVILTHQGQVIVTPSDNSAAGMMR